MRPLARAFANADEDARAVSELGWVAAGLGRIRHVGAGQLEVRMREEPLERVGDVARSAGGGVVA